MKAKYQNDEIIKYYVRGKIYTGRITNNGCYDENRRYLSVMRLNKLGNKMATKKFDDYICESDVTEKIA